jgi:hypothetical protein
MKSAVRYGFNHPFMLGRTTIPTGHARIDTAFVQKNQMGCIKEFLLRLPLHPPFHDIRTVLFRCVRRFFFGAIPVSDSGSCTVPGHSPARRTLQ